MKLLNLLEGAVPKGRLLDFQEQLIDQLDDDFSIDIAVDKIMIRHPSLRTPMKLDLRNPEEVPFYAQRCSIDHPRFISGVVEIIKQRTDLPKMKAWLLANNFNLIPNRKAVEEKHNVLISAGSAAEFYLRESRGPTDPPVLVVLGFDSYKNAQYHYMLLPFDKFPKQKYLMGTRFFNYDHMISALK